MAYLTAVELGIGKQAHEVRRVARLDMVPLEMQRDVSEGCRVPVDVEGADGRGGVDAVVLSVLELAAEVLGKV